ncbi:hypothetical protein [Pantoea agglomerans]|uniref:hypothetical protein n=1 Tax=Enterobacter agglomerans TaxID=549 RepID=UPI003C7ED0B6
MNIKNNKTLSSLNLLIHHQIQVSMLNTLTCDKGKETSYYRRKIKGKDDFHSHIIELINQNSDEDNSSIYLDLLEVISDEVSSLGVYCGFYLSSYTTGINEIYKKIAIHSETFSFLHSMHERYMVGCIAFRQENKPVRKRI